jgi:hypothetical protein
LSPRASLLFHGYCDGDNAPFKNVAIVFILHTNLDLKSLQGDPTISFGMSIIFAEVTLYKVFTILVSCFAIHVPVFDDFGPDGTTSNKTASFENEHFRSIAVDHFEQLSPRASLLFHGYCDGDNAPFKNVAIVFILHTNLDRTVPLRKTLEKQTITTTTINSLQQLIQ